MSAVSWERLFKETVRGDLHTARGDVFGVL